MMKNPQKNPHLDGFAATGLYIFTLSLIAWPVADLVLNIWPLQPGNTQWRYGAAGLLSSFLHTPMLGLVVALATAYVAGHRTILRLLGVLQIAVATVLLAIMALFIVDLFDVAGTRPPGGLPTMLTGVAVASGKYLVAALAMGLLGLGILRGAPGRDRGRRDPARGVVVRPGGTGAGAAATTPTTGAGET
jgi:hypothetical protein